MPSTAIAARVILSKTLLKEPFKSLDIPGTYLYTIDDELANLWSNFANAYYDEGVAWNIVI